MTDNEFDPIYNRDWVSAFLKRTRLTPIMAGLLFFLLDVLVLGLLAASSNTWIGGPSGPGLIEDYQVLASGLLFQPTVIATFCWLPRGVAQLYTQIAKENALESKTDLRASYEALRLRLQNPWVVPLAFLWAAFSCALEYYVFFQPLYLSWMTGHPFFFWVLLPTMFIFFFMLAAGFYDLLVILPTVNALFRKHAVRVQSLHPDKAGGLGAVGRFTANLGYAVGAVGLFLSVILIQHPANSTSYYNIMTGMMFVVYFLMAPLGFYFPLWSAHLAMLSVRNSLARDVSMEFDAAYSRLHDLRPDDADRAEPLLKRLRQLNEERDLVYRFPVWPFDSSSLRKFFGLAFSPLVPIATSLLLDILGKWIP